MKKLVILITLLSQSVLATPYQPSKLEIELRKRLIDSWLEIEYQEYDINIQNGTCTDLLDP